MPDAQGRRETAVLLVVAERAPALAALHREHGLRAVARGLPLHLTLLYPFVPAVALDDRALGRLRAALAPLAPLRFTLDRVVRAEEDGTLQALPRSADALTTRMSALRAAFPELPPYGRPGATPHPHVTVADAASALGPGGCAGALPVDVQVDAAALWEEGADGRWRERLAVPFAGESA